LIALSCVLVSATLALAGGAVAANQPPPKPPVVVTPLKLLDRNQGWVISHPHVVNLFWDSDWTKHNPYSRHQVDVATKAITDSRYLNDAGQYGVGKANFAGSHSSSQLCPNRRPGTSVSSAALFKWVTCEVSTLAPPSRAPVTNDLFVVFVPRRTTLVDGPSLPSISILGNTFGPFSLPLFQSCRDYDGYHFLSLSITGPFAYAVVPIGCAADLRDITETLSHELVETATDPVLTTGWIDDAYSLSPPSFDRLVKGEAGDICSSSGSHPTAAATVAGGLYRIAAYWSNAAGSCVSHF
jgi:hypothetical protein